MDIDPALAAFRAVRVSAGDHEVRFTYRPASASIGAAITLLTLIGDDRAAGAAGPATSAARSLARINVNRAPPPVAERARRLLAAEPRLREPSDRSE